MAKKWYNFFVVTPGDGAASSPAATGAPAPAAAALRVADVVPEPDPESFAPSAESPVSNDTSMEDIYSSARIPMPGHGYTILKVSDMLQSEHIRTLPPDVKTKSIMVALDAAGVDVKSVIEDAVQRDRALDTYERVLEKHLEELRARKDQESRRLEEEINQKLQELRTRIEENNNEVNRETESLLAWRARKRQEEDRIAEAVGYFVTENPITVTGADSKGGGQDVR